MKKLIAVVILSFICTCAFAQGTLRSIIFADTNDDRIGLGIQNNLRWIQEEIDIIASCIDMENRTAAPLVYEQYKCNPQNLRQCIRNFKCGKDDIVLFFYFGHGMRSPQDISDFPQMCLGTDASKQSQWVPLEDVKIFLLKQSPRFLLVFGDLCNSADQFVSRKRGVLGGALESASATKISNVQKEAMKRLFLNCRGSVITSGSSKTEESWYRTDSEGYGWFTKAFLDELESYTSETTNVDWETLINTRTRQAVQKMIEEHRKDDPVKFKKNQTPQAHVRVTYGITPKVTTNNEKIKDKEITTINNDLMNDRNTQHVDNASLRSALIDIASETNSPSYRIGKRSSVLSHFANSNVWVEIVGRNNTTIVSTELASDFVERISTAFHLRNFTILYCTRDGNGKITALRIHEIYER